ncbi:MAG TPA: RodZ domain-containing protein [Steroidobacteraceae bacterium]|nr:RodZ domain-containing protein [Steroidobacteraceae bacterium]
MSAVAETLGQRLKAERERKGMSAQKAADQLHLDGWVIDALESDDYARIGPSVYGKGHLKRYAGLLGLPATEILEAYDTRSSVPASAAPQPTLRMRTSATDGQERPWLLIAGFAVILAGIVAGVLWWRPWQPRAAVVPTATATHSEAAKSTSVGAEERTQSAEQNREPGGADRLVDESAVAAGGPIAGGRGRVGGGDASGYAGSGDADGRTAGVGVGGRAGGVDASGRIAGSQTVDTLNSSASNAAASGVAVSASDAASTAGLGRARLRLSFSADSWVDVRDATGRRLFAGNGRANSVKTIAGDAPMKVYLGFASGVQLEVNNHVVAIGPQFLAGDVARFEAGADGVLRRDARAASAADPRPRG